MNQERRNFPFAAIIGQNLLKTAYLANIVNPKIGGLLISGPKGTGKSTIVHSVKDILPSYKKVSDCVFNCEPGVSEKYCSLCKNKEQIEEKEVPMKIVNLPLSCSEDRLIGNFNIEKLLQEGKKVVEAGILGEANRNILYVDEVNLLPDHLVDDILDAAASHWNSIEREGISIAHSTDFILVGTMNPEEGELRPQILDRFPICVKVNSVFDPEERVEIIKRNMLFENNPIEFYTYFEDDEEELRKIIENAKSILSEIVISDGFLFIIAQACAELQVDGQRPDLVIVKTALTIAALDDRKEVIKEDILMSAELTLNHRTRDGGLLEPPLREEIIEVFCKYFEKESQKDTNNIEAHSSNKFASKDFKIKKDKSFLNQNKSQNGEEKPGKK